MAQEVATDSIQTPFRQGRWLTGLSGTISSSTVDVRGSEDRSTSNQFGFNIFTGQFIRDRWLLGGTLRIDRTNAGTERTAETLFIGPLTNYYISKGINGSLFTQLSPGYVRYRDEVRLSDISEESEGSGFGLLFGLGYSYVINDQIAFDLGVNANVFWLDIEVDTQLEDLTSSQRLFVNDFVFFFGFNIILDDFFF